MAVRPVFEVLDKAPYYQEVQISFVFSSGFSKTQKQKNIQAIHQGYVRCFPDKRVLEISSKSMQEGGEALSAFFLPKYVPSLGRSVPVENVFQAGKVFANGGPYTDLLTVSPRDAKRDERLRGSGPLRRFVFEGQDYPLAPKTIFYDYIYINALLENPDRAKVALSYDAFTDVEFNPEKSLNCQARAAAIFVSLSRLGKLDQVKEFSSFLALFQAPAAAPPGDFAIGDRIIHKTWGEGIVVSVSPVLKIHFDSVGDKAMAPAWVKANCQVVKVE